MKKLTIYEVRSPLHDAEAVARAHKDLLKVLNETFDVTHLNITDIEEGTTPVLFVATGGVEGLVLEACKKHPVKGLVLLADGLQNSLAASMEIASWARTQGIQAIILHGTPQEIAKQLTDSGSGDANESITGSNDVCTGALSGAKIGLFGDPSDWLISSHIDYEVVSKKLGVEFVRVPLSEVVEAYNACAKPKSGSGPTENVLQELPRREPSNADITDAVRLADAIAAIVERRGLDAITLQCFELLSSLKTTGCLALSMLSARGIPGGCEGDVPALLTMLLAQRVTGERAFMCNPSGIDKGKNEIILAHCTLPWDMGKDNVLRSHFESGIGVAIQAQMPLGPATLVKWWGKEMNEAYVSDAEILENLDNPSLCRTQIRLKVAQPLTALLQHPLGNHQVVIPGHHAEALRKALSR